MHKIPPPPPWPEPAVTGLVEVTDDPIHFTPVPRQRKRRNRWTSSPNAPSSPRWRNAAASPVRRAPSA